MKNLLLLFILLLSVLGCAPEPVLPEEGGKDSETKDRIDSIRPFEPGSCDTVWLEEEK